MPGIRLFVPGKTREFLSFLPKFPSFSEKKYLTNKKRLGTQLPGSNSSWDLDEMLSRIGVMVNIGNNYYLFYFARYLYLLHTASTKTGRTTAGAQIWYFLLFWKSKMRVSIKCSDYQVCKTGRQLHHKKGSKRTDVSGLFYFMWPSPPSTFKYHDFNSWAPLSSTFFFHFDRDRLRLWVFYSR